jgi:RimJ/RimL family protein N-acetyltransferase
MDPIVSARLRLVPLPVAAFQALAEDDDAAACAASGLALPRTWPGRYPWDAWARALVADPASAPWAARAGVLTATGAVVANIGFHGPPSGGVVEIGYSVEPEHRRRGYAVEAAGALLAWASRQPGVTAVNATTDPDNAASQQVLLRLGFEAVGSHADERGHVQLMFTRPLGDGTDQPRRRGQGGQA